MKTKLLKILKNKFKITYYPSKKEYKIKNVSNINYYTIRYTYQDAKEYQRKKNFKLWF